MTEAQQRFVNLEKQRDQYKAYLKELDTALSEVAVEVGLDGYFQDDEGTVYKVVAPTGKWIAFDPIGYTRTKREGEEKGTLSVKEAKENGFNL